MKIPLVDLAAQYSAIKSEIDRAIAAVIADTAFVGNMTNRYVHAFEEEFAAYCGAKYCIACANGTDAIEIALRASGVGSGDEVIVPAVSWIATSEAVTNVGAVPVFVDVAQDVYTLDVDLIAKACNERTKAIIPVHLYGLPADMRPIIDLATQRRLIVIEDCAQAHGARYHGCTVGTMGIAGCFSFFPGKNLGAYGDAGGIITNDENVAAHARMICQHGQAKEKHDHRIEGRNSRMDGMQAAILSVKLRYLRQWTEARRANAKRYDALLSRGVARQVVPAGLEHVYHLYTIQIDGRDAVAENLTKAGIGVGIQYPRALPFLTAYGSRGYSPDAFPIARRLASATMSLPMFPELTEGQICAIVDELHKASR